MCGANLKSHIRFHGVVFMQEINLTFATINAAVDNDTPNDKNDDDDDDNEKFV
jgi:hypothetical protein